MVVHNQSGDFPEWSREQIFLQGQKPALSCGVSLALSWLLAPSSLEPGLRSGVSEAAESVWGTPCTALGLFLHSTRNPLTAPRNIDTDVWVPRVKAPWSLACVEWLTWRRVS